MASYATQHSAGGMVYRVRRGEPHSRGSYIDVAMIKDSYGRWTFPKGHIEPNETTEEAAKREIAEEIGIDAHTLKTRKELGEMDYWFTPHFDSDKKWGTPSKPSSSRMKQSAGFESTPLEAAPGLPGLQPPHGRSVANRVKIHKYVTYFLFEVPSDTVLTPQPGEVDAVTWVPLREVDDHNEYEDNRELIARAKRYLRSLR